MNRDMFENPVPTKFRKGKNTKQPISFENTTGIFYGNPENGM